MTNVYPIADRRNLPCDGQAARLPQGARQGAGVESGETTSPQTSGDIVIATQPRVAQNAAQRLPATRDAAYRKEVGAPPALPPSLVATINGCPRVVVDGIPHYPLGPDLGIAYKDAIGWRWTRRIGTPGQDIWNQAFIEALEERAGQ